MQREKSVNEEARARQLAGLKPFQKGQSGNPAGRPKTAILSNAIRKKLTEIDETDPQRRTYAEILVEQLVMKAKTGDVQALKEIADRTEGKARQSVSLTTDKHERYEREIETMIEAAESLGEPCTREEAIAALSIYHPEVSHLLQ
jgi:ribosomal protein L18E